MELSDLLDSDTLHYLSQGVETDQSRDQLLIAAHNSFCESTLSTKQLVDTQESASLPTTKEAMINDSTPTTFARAQTRPAPNLPAE